MPPSSKAEREYLAALTHSNLTVAPTACSAAISVLTQSL